MTERPDTPRQSPRYREGTVTLRTVDHGEVTVPEPTWCLGHDDEYVGYLSDVTHNGRLITTTAETAAHGPVEVAQGYISHAPHTVKRPEPYPTLYVALDLHESFGPEDGRNVTRALRVAATRFDLALKDLARMRGEGQ